MIHKVLRSRRRQANAPRSAQAAARHTQGDSAAPRTLKASGKQSDGADDDKRRAAGAVHHHWDGGAHDETRKSRLPVTRFQKPTLKTLIFCAKLTNLGAPPTAATTRIDRSSHVDFSKWQRLTFRVDSYVRQRASRVLRAKKGQGRGTGTSACHPQRLEARHSCLARRAAESGACGGGVAEGDHSAGGLVVQPQAQ